MENRNNDNVDAVLLWDTRKMQIRSSSLKYAREKKAKKTEENEFSPVSRSRGGGSEYLEPFSPKQLMRSLRVRGVPDNGIRLKQCCNGDNLILINI